MSDPLEVLRVPPASAFPDPEFVALLLARVQRALGLPRGVAVTDTQTLTRPSSAEPEGGADTRHVGAAVPYLGVRDARAALEWYVEVFGARRRGEPYVMPDGRIGHAELAFPDGLVFVSEGDHPEIGVASADPAAPASSVSLVLRVEGLDGVLNAARRSGARVVREPYEGYGARNATIFDPFGHRWMLTEPVAAAPVRPRHGDLAYLSLWVPDVGRAAAFYRSVLGWDPTGAGPARQVHTTVPPQGLWTADEAAVFCCYAVDDIAAALARVEDAGGEAGPPSDEPYGTVATCSDDRGGRFALVQLPAASGGEADPPPHGRRQGDIAYLSLTFPDPDAARAFYGAVLGWQFTPGRSPGGFDVERVAPMSGVGGPAGRATAMPMYRVDDIAAAVGRVRAAGGTATEPARRPYGMESECADDQGVRFYLGQLF